MIGNELRLNRIPVSILLNKSTPFQFIESDFMFWLRFYGNASVWQNVNAFKLDKDKSRITGL